MKRFMPHAHPAASSCCASKPHSAQHSQLTHTGACIPPTTAPLGLDCPAGTSRTRALLSRASRSSGSLPLGVEPQEMVQDQPAPRRTSLSPRAYWWRPAPYVHICAWVCVQCRRDNIQQSDRMPQLKTTCTPKCGPWALAHKGGSAQ